MLSILSMLTGSACADPPAWPASTASAELLSPGQVDGAQQAIDALSKGDRARVHALLDQAAAQQPGLDGFGVAVASLSSGIPGLMEGRAEVPGGDPLVGAAKEGALCVLQAHVVRSGQVIAAGPEPEVGALALLNLIQGATLFDEGQRARLQSEARLGLGPPLYLAVAPQMDAAAPTRGLPPGR